MNFIVEIETCFFFVEFPEKYLNESSADSSKWKYSSKITLPRAQIFVRHNSPDNICRYTQPVPLFALLIISPCEINQNYVAKITKLFVPEWKIE